MPLKIIVVGAGIAGPAVAIGLARTGHDVTLHERDESTEGVGYAFRVTRNCERCLRHLGVDVLEGGAVESRTVRLLDQSGEVVVEKRENDGKINGGDGGGGVSVFAGRSQVNGQLIAVCREVGVKMRMGVKVTSVDVEKTTVTLDGRGEILRADVIIAADGVHSVVRPVVCTPTKAEPYASTGHNAFRFMLTQNQIASDEVLKGLLDDGVRMFVWHGKKSRKWILSYPIDGGKLYNIACPHPAELTNHQAGGGASDANISYSNKISKETALKVYEEFEPRARRIIELADPDSLRIWKMQDTDEIPSWSRNNTVLMGDACHPVQPFSTAGAAIAMEDAVTLETVLGLDVRKEDVAARLMLYEKIQKERVGRIRQEGRDRGVERGEEGYSQSYAEFLSGHDAVGYAKDALKQYFSGNINKSD